MNQVAEQLEMLRQRIAAGNAEDATAHYQQRLAVTQTGETFNLDFYGDCAEEGYHDLLETVAAEAIAPSIRSLLFRGPDTGANGTMNWDVSALVATDVEFSQLETFALPLNGPAIHNRSIVGAGYEEDGVLAEFLRRAPALQELTVPSAPNEAFFEIGQRPLRFLSIDAGYDCQDFVSNLANSSCFPELRCLEWGEYNETYIDDYLEDCTPFEHYKQLFESNLMAGVTRFVWRNPVCTRDQIKELKKLKPNLQFMVVQYSDEYMKSV